MCSLIRGSELLDLSGWGHFYCVGAGPNTLFVLKNSVSSGMKGGILRPAVYLLAMQY